jgi:hypothetical protein
MRSQWRVFWRSAAAGLVTPTDRPALERLFLLRDPYARALDLAGQAMLVRGSTGQLRVNPLLDLVTKLAGQIGRLEAEFGLTCSPNVDDGVPS